MNSNINRKAMHHPGLYFYYRVTTGHGISRNHGKVMEFYLVRKSHAKLNIFEKVMELFFSCA